MISILFQDCRLTAWIGTVNEGPCHGQPSDDAEIEELTPQEMDGQTRDENDKATREEEAEHDPDQDQSASSIIGDIRYDTIYPNSRAPIEERTKKAPKLVVQQMEYLRLMEDRMNSVEEKLRLIENEGVEPEPSPQTPPKKSVQSADFIMGIKRMNFQEYSPIDPTPEVKVFVKNIEHKHRYEFPGQLPYHLIDVVVNAAHQSERLSKDQGTKPTVYPPDSAASHLVASSQNPTTIDGQSFQPERIRINSPLLLEALARITGLKFKESRLGDEPEVQDQVILRPFKLFVTFEQQIRDEIDRLEKKHIGDDNDGKPEAPEMASGEGQKSPPLPDSIPHDVLEDLSQRHLDGVEDDESRYSKAQATDVESRLESRQCLEEMLVLRELLDNDMKPTYDLRKKIKEGVVRSLAFQDLWHLFPIGDEIVSNNSNGQYQTYRVLNVSGGRPFLCNRYEADMDSWEPTSNARDLPKFEILSYSYGYDGKELGVCQEMHTIKSYDGYKAIASLPCIPIIYSRNAKGLKSRDFFVGRGRRFIELTHDTDVVHKRYNGRTLAMDELREEVRLAL